MAGNHLKKILASKVPICSVSDKSNPQPLAPPALPWQQLTNHVPIGADEKFLEFVCTKTVVGAGVVGVDAEFSFMQV